MCYSSFGIREWTRLELLVEWKQELSRVNDLKLHRPWIHDEIEPCAPRARPLAHCDRSLSRTSRWPHYLRLQFDQAYQRLSLPQVLSWKSVHCQSSVPARILRSAAR